MEKIRLEVARLRVRVHDCFLDFDRLRCGRISNDQFRRCLASTRLIHVLTEDNLRALEATYATPTSPPKFNYVRFLADLEGSEPSELALSPSRGLRQSLPPDEAAALQEAMDHFLHRVLSAGIDMEQQFKPFDPLHVGRVTRAQFERAFPFEVAPEILSSIERRYADEKGDISYRNWVNDVLEPLRASPSQAPPSVDTTPTVSRSLAEILPLLRMHAAWYRHRCDEAFFDFDKMRRGSVSPAQFASALGRLRLNKINLTASDIEKLVQQYVVLDGDGRQGVDYVAFMRDVGEPMNRGRPSLTETELRQGCAALERIRRLIQLRRISIAETFYDFDRASKGIYRSRLCTRSQFGRALASHNLLLSKNDARMLALVYAVPNADGTPSDDVNYFEFLRDIEWDETMPLSDTMRHMMWHQPSEVRRSGGDDETTEPSAVEATAALENDGSHEPLPSRGAPEAEMDAHFALAITKIQDVLLDHRVRMKEFMKSFDSLRSGAIERHKFFSALSMCKMFLSQPELNALANYFASEKVKGHVSYERFLNEVDTIVVINRPPEEPLDREAQLLEKRHSPRPQTARIGLEAVLARTRECVKAKGILLPAFFRDFDVHCCGRVSEAQFEEAVSRYGLPFSRLDMAALVEHYRGNRPGEIRYRDFIGDVDETENVPLQHSFRKTMRGAGRPFAESTTWTPAATDRFGDASATLQKIAVMVRRRRLRLAEFFHDGDLLRHGFVTATRFRHAIDILGIHLTEDELRGLEQVFESKKERLAVDYGDFLRTASSVNDDGTLNVEGTFQDDQMASRVIHKISTVFSNRRVASRPLFQEVDRLKKGRVTEAQFFSCLLSAGVTLSANEVSVIKAACDIGDGLMAYDSFCAAVDSKV